MIEAIISGAIFFALLAGSVVLYVKSKWTKETSGKIKCLFGFHKWESDKPDAQCVRCGIARNWREKYMQFHYIAGF